MKICPLCGTTAPDSSVTCQADGTALSALATATTLPARRSSVPWCPTCGAREGEALADCPRCGSRISKVPSTMPGRPGSKIAGFTVLASHGDGDVLVADPAAGPCLLAFGQKEAIAAEAAALAVRDARFLALARQGTDPELGHYLVLLARELEGAVPIVEAELSIADGFALCKSVLDVAAALEARGLAWEPSPTDFYLRGGELLVVRARGARRLGPGEHLNAKRVMEALAGALLPEPFSVTTPEVVRLLLPRWNFSTVATCTVAEAGADLARARALVDDAPLDHLAELCDPGLRRNHAEDATAVARGSSGDEPFAVLVVCDGVSSSARAGQAATLASSVVRDSLAEFARSGDGMALESGASDAVARAIRAAHVAVCEANVDHGSGAPPGTTVVAAFVHRRRLTVGWLGDSRAYWVTEAGDAELCTADHSWLNEALARGSVPVDEAMESPFAHALTKCLGPLEANIGSGGVDPEVRSRPLAGPGHLVLCTDGLWNYFPSPEQVAELVRARGGGASAIARFLVCRALAEGGGDNVSVVVHRVE